MEIHSPPLRLAFIDLSDLAYDVTCPLNHPMGGSESGLCYLAAALAGRGHAVTIINGVPEPASVQGVQLFLNRAISRDYFHAENFDAVVVIKGPVDATRLKPLLPAPSKLFLWTGHAADQPAVQGLSLAEMRKDWDGFIAVSDWQRQCFIAQLGVAPGSIHVLRNAISPAFENLFTGAEELQAAKAGRVRLAYTSTPFRGLDTLLDIFGQLNALDTGAELEIYSSMQLYGVPASGDPFAPLYAAARALPNVRYVGAVAQSELAKAMRGVSILSYPNSFAETSCIAVMEAMASGAYILTSELGALPETMSGFGRLLPRDSRYVQSYLVALQDIINRMKNDRRPFFERQYEQVQFANRQFNWSLRARQWEEFLAGKP